MSGVLSSRSEERVQCTCKKICAASSVIFQWLLPIRKSQSSPEGRALFLIKWVDTHEIEYTLVPLPNTKGKSDQWKHFSLWKQNTASQLDADDVVWKQCNSIIKLAVITSNVSTHMKRHHPLLLLGSPVENKGMADILVHISRYTSTLYQYGCIISVCYQYIFHTSTQL